MIIRKNIKSKVTSRPIKSLSRKKSKSDLSFYSSIERDIRDIEMKLYRIKKALKYYSEDGEENTNETKLTPDDFEKILSQALDAEEEYIRKLASELQRREDNSEIKNNSKSIKYRNRLYYSEEKKEKEPIKEVRERVYKVLKHNFEDLFRLNPEKMDEKSYSLSYEENVDVKSLANEAINLIDDVNLSIQDTVTKVSYTASAALAGTAGAVMAVSHDAISKLGEPGFLDYALNHPYVGVQLVAILSLIFGSVCSFLLAKGRESINEQAANSLIKRIKNAIRISSKKVVSSRDEGKIKDFVDSVTSIKEIVDSSQGQKMTLEDFKNAVGPHLQALEQKVAK